MQNSTWILRILLIAFYPTLAFGGLGATTFAVVVCESYYIATPIAGITVFAISETRWCVLWLSTPAERKLLERMMKTAGVRGWFRRD